MEARWAEDAPKSESALPQQRENLVFRALEKAAGPTASIDVKIRKRIPLGAGLGGGSSDAGAVLRELVARGHLNSEQAAELALGLGADVPYFLDCRPSWVEGIGERRQALTVAPEVLENLHFLLIVPPEATPTPIIFSQFRALRVPFAPLWEMAAHETLDWTRLEAYLEKAENSLQGVAAAQYPLLGDILSRLARVGALYSGLSGTGSTCFAVFRSAQGCADASQVMASFCRKSGCRRISTRTFVGP